jgi:hypothetical protein
MGFSQRDAKAAEGKTIEELSTIDEGMELRVLPHWLAQPASPLPAKKEKQSRPGESSLVFSFPSHDHVHMLIWV